jgi:hypothetical protein
MDLGVRNLITVALKSCACLHTRKLEISRDLYVTLLLRAHPGHPESRNAAVTHFYQQHSEALDCAGFRSPWALAL